MVYELPFGKNLTGVGRQVLAGWQINTIIAYKQVRSSRWKRRVISPTPDLSGGVPFGSAMETSLPASATETSGLTPVALRTHLKIPTGMPRLTAWTDPHGIALICP